MRLSERDIVRFWSRVRVVDDADSCWEATRGIGSNGYPVFWWAGRNWKASRIAFLIEHGRWPTDCMLHRCDNPRCVRPSHLFEGTVADNKADCVAKGRQSRGRRHAEAVAPTLRHGEDHHAAKLSRRKVEQMRARYCAGESISDLRRAFGVTWRTAKQAIHGETWKFLEAA